MSTRREFCTPLGGAAARPMAARAQQPERNRLIGVLLPLVEDDSLARKKSRAFVMTLKQAG